MFFNKNVNQKAILDFVTKFKEIGNLQQFAILHNDELQVRFAVHPYETSDVKQLFSISKTFTSLAIGKAVDEGKLNLHAKVLDFFRGMFPPNVKFDPNLEKMEVYHLLTMNTGHPSCTMGQISCGNPVKAFLELPIPYEPGTYFAYNTGASLILAVILNIVTGKDVDEYLKPILDEMGIHDYYFEKIMGNCLGGVGQHTNIDALLSLGSLLLHKGKCNGKQLISKEYIELATSNLVDNSRNGTPDWTCGYGLHLWRGLDGFRADGAFGQLSMVIPKKNIVIAVQANVNSMQKEIDLIRELVSNLYADCDVEDIESKINDVYKIEVSKALNFEKQEMICESNRLGINNISISNLGDKLSVVFTGTNSFTIEAGNGYYIKSKFMATGIKNKHNMMPPFIEESIISSHYVYDGNKLTIYSKNHNTPLPQEFIFEYQNDDCKVIVNNVVITAKICNR